MALSKIQTGLVDTNAVGATELNLADNFAFTGTVTGAGNMPLVSSGSSTTDAGSLEISLNYSNYEHFLLLLSIKGTSTSSSENLDVRWKRDGQSYNTGSSDYSVAGHYQDGNTNRNANGQNTMELFWTNYPATNWVASIWFWNVGNTTKQNKLESSIMKAKSDGNSAYLAHGAINNETNNLNKIIETQFFFTAGDVDEYAYQLYGVSA
jgi:hypothetical protein